jgi:hypothetical protein
VIIRYSIFGGMTIKLDGTFLKSKKDGRIYCGERKDGIFLSVPRYNKRTLFPIIKHFVHPNTKTICTDQGRWYHGVGKIFHPFTPEHKTTIYSSGEFVHAMDPSNTICPHENENK